MKRLLTGTGLALAIASGAHAAEAAPAQAEKICAPVYDETLTGDSSQLLLSQIGDYATNGIEVHVQILEDGRSRGIYAPEDTEGFAEDLAERCEWTDPDRVNVVVSLDPRAYDIHRTKQADKDISPGAVASAEEGFIEDLRDSSTSYQQDVGMLLKDISPYSKIATPPTSEHVEDTPNNDNEEDPFSMPSIPWKNLGIGTLGAGTIAGAAARAKRAMRIKNIRRHTAEDANGASQNGQEAWIAARQLLDIVPADDALEARTAQGRLDDALLTVTAAEKAVEAGYKQQRYRAWPSLSTLEDLEAQAQQAISKAQVDTEQLARSTKELQDLINTIDSDMATFHAQIEALEQSITNLESAGWDLTPLREKLAGYRTQYTAIESLRAQSYVDQPANTIDELDDGVLSDTETAEGLPEQLVDAQSMQTRQESFFATLKIGDHQHQLETIRSRYDSSCYSDITRHGAELEELWRKAKSNLGSSTELLQVLSIEKLLAAERIQQETATIYAGIDGLIADIQKRAQQLATLTEELPGTFAELTEEARQGFQHARDAFGKDVEPETLEQLQAMEEAVRTAQSGLSDEKPRLLELKQAAQKIQSRQKELNKRAADEHSEMQALRSQSESLFNEARTSLDRLLSYASDSDVSGRTRASAREVAIDSIELDLDRRNLREQVSGYQTTIATIDAIRTRAASEVRRAEEERERQRRAEQERQRRKAEERRRRDDSSSFGGGFGASSSFGSFGGGSGGGGGSSHSSGTW